jgi:uncharacterized integral membrane protein
LLLGALGRGLLRVLAGLVLLVGILSAVTLAVFVTHPCGHLEMDEFATCGAARPALVVAIGTGLFAALVCLAGRGAGNGTRTRKRQQ